MFEPSSKLEPIIESLGIMNIGEFLQTRDFKNLIQRIGICDYWYLNFQHVKLNREFAGIRNIESHLLETLNVVLNYMIEENRNLFFRFIKEIVEHFSKNNTLSSVNKVRLIEDLDALKCPTYILEEIDDLPHWNLYDEHKIEIPHSINSMEQLKYYVDRMDLSINDCEFNLTLTFAYSILEGLFKGFVKYKEISFDENSDLKALSKLTKQIIIDILKKDDMPYPEQMVNLITTVTKAVSSARNEFSVSHFDKIADRWLAEFVRDCVKAVGRLIINLY